jgi:hypothetical protein
MNSSTGRVFVVVVEASDLTTPKEKRGKSINKTGEGQNYEFHNVKNQKEHRKIWRPSLHQKSSLK